MMGDLVLLQEEVNPVMSALLDTGWKLPHFTTISSGKSPESSSCMYTATEKRSILPSAFKPALDLIPPPPTAAPATAPAAGPRL